MISVGSRDARKGMSLGFDSGGGVGDMEETELEEGEAFSYHNNDGYDESIDPDVALSYIDEKLQDVLGHFQKDFEGGVSAENLGAKFGGYGSFLPTYQRSPVWSHPRTPGKVQNFSSPRSPTNSQLENGFRHSAVSSSQSVSLAPASTSATSLPALKPPSLNEKLAPRNNESANKKTSKSSDQKTLKVRIKVGSDNLSTRKNAEIYSGLGLDVSPSSSLDESPSGSDEGPNESPTNILQIMTSFAIPGNLLLSPLPDDLLRLTEKTTYMKDSHFPVKGEKKSTGLKKKETVNEALGCEELVSNTLKLPLLSNEPDWVVEKPKVVEDKKESSFDKMKKALYAELMDPPKQKVNQKPATTELNGKKLHAEKRKSKESSRLGSSIHKSKKNTHANGSTTKSELEELKLRKEIVKARDAYKDFFGEMNLDEQERQIDASELPSEGRLKDSGVIEKTDRLSMSEAYPKAVSNIVPQPTNGPGPNPDGLSSLVGTQFIQENWVGCDKCQRWRLLPLGTNPEDLPDKWTCSMLNWLPKMNRCSVTEEETTKALLALYQVPTADNQNYLHNAGPGLSGAPPSGFWNQSHQNYGLQKKKQGLKEPANTPSTDLPKRNLPPLMNKSDSQQLSKSGDLPVEKHLHKHKEKQKVTENYSDGGDTRHLKMKSKKDDADQDWFRASKKVKTESDEDWRLDHGGSSSGFDAKKDQLKYSDRGSSKERYDTKDMSQVLAKKTKEEAFGSLEFGNCDDNRMVTPKKRKVKEGQDPVEEEFSENDYRKEKKARVSKGRSQQSLDGTDYAKREVATSSSSKISGSHKTKTSFQEVKGSPVESVSSSPMRVLDLASSRKELKEKDETRGAEFLKCSDVEEKDKTFSVTHRSMDSMLDLHDKNFNNLSGSKAKTKVVLSSDNITNHHPGNESQPRKSGKGSSRSKDKSRREKHEDVSKSKSKSKSKVSGSVNETQDTKVRESKSKFQEKPGGKSDESEKKHVSKKDSSRKLSGTEKKHDDPLSTPKLNLQNHDGERSSKRSEKNEQKDSASGKGRPLPLPPSGSGQSRPVSVTHKGNEGDKLTVDGFEVDDALKVQKAIKKADNQQVNSRLATPSGHRVRDHEVPSPLRRDSSSHAASSALKEAKDLKHRADRIKNTESDMERTDLYFEAVLKFLRASSLLESSNSENGKHGEMIQAMQIYSSTAKLCDFCAHEYEKQKNIAFAALAYKCTEVAYMRVIYSSHSGASRDRHELQTALQMVPPGESPSSSASDVDNLNNLAAADKVIIPKSVGSPQVAGNHVIAAKTRPNFSRLLNFTQDVHLAMEASRKSRVSFAAANATFSDAKYKEGIASIRRALDFNFQDVEGLLRLVRLAMEAFNP